MQSQVVSGVPPFFSISVLFPTEDYPPFLSASLFPCFFFCFACLSLYLYHFSGLLSHPTPPLSLSLVVFLFASQKGFPGRSFLLLAVGEADVQQAAGDHKDAQHWESVRWNNGILNFMQLNLCLFIHPPQVTLDIKCNMFIQNKWEPNKKQDFTCSIQKISSLVLINRVRLIHQHKNIINNIGFVSMDL